MSSRKALYESSMLLPLGAEEDDELTSGFETVGVGRGTATDEDEITGFGFDLGSAVSRRTRTDAGTCLSYQFHKRLDNNFFHFKIVKTIYPIQSVFFPKKVIFYP